MLFCFCLVADKFVIRCDRAALLEETAVLAGMELGISVLTELLFELTLLDDLLTTVPVGFADNETEADGALIPLIGVARVIPLVFVIDFLELIDFSESSLSTQD